MPSAIAQAPIHRITPVMVFSDATPLGKLIMVVLFAAMVAAIVVTFVKLARGRRLNGGSAFLSGLRLGGPILGGLGACNSFFMMTLGIANIPADLPLKAMAPGFAEAFMEIGVGFLAGVIAVLCNWAVESRIDRQVLGV